MTNHDGFLAAVKIYDYIVISHLTNGFTAVTEAGVYQELQQV